MTFPFQNTAPLWVKMPRTAGFKDLLKGTNGLDALQSEPVSGELAEPAFVLAIQVYAFVVVLVLGDDFLTGLIEVFLKASTAARSFFTWDLRATFIFALNLRITKPWKVLYFIAFPNFLLNQSNSSLKPTIPLKGSLNFAFSSFSCSSFILLGLWPVFACEIRALRPL